MSKSIYTDRDELLRALLIEKRKAAGLTQEAVAERLGKPQSFVSKYETGERRLDVIEFLDVAKAIGVDACEVVEAFRNSRRA